MFTDKDIIIMGILTSIKKRLKSIEKENITFSNKWTTKLSIKYKITFRKIKKMK